MDPQNPMLGQLMNGMMGIKRPQMQRMPQGQAPNMQGFQSQMMGLRPAQKMRKPMPQMHGDARSRIAQLLMGLR